MTRDRYASRMGPKRILDFRTEIFLDAEAFVAQFDVHAVQVGPEALLKRIDRISGINGYIAGYKIFFSQF